MISVRFAPAAAPHPNPLPVKRGEGTCPARAGRGTERSRHIPFAPRAGRRWRQPDEGQAAVANSPPRSPCASA
ncbi:hypothetical protein ELG88_00760 [Rhizobium leguminosarum]|nr:hypothetical protein ELG88_00760 [Rhizobium leguminosarum]TBG40398.1 hypothetical protein ELG77_00755 [Rhizobium leguminosarum]TBH57060.1 hypothetical protein ELG65_00755 [Rhizobium leguminosarum]